MPVTERQTPSRDKDLSLSGNKLPPLIVKETSVKKGTAKETVSANCARQPEERQKTTAGRGLVLQVYNHMKVQRKLEEDRNSKISRAERRRQKLKRDLEAVSSSKVSSRIGGFTARWIYHRGGYGPLGQQRSTQENKESVVTENTNSAETQEADCQPVVPPLGDDFSNVGGEESVENSPTAVEQDPETDEGGSSSDTSSASREDVPLNSYRSTTDADIPANSHPATRDFGHSVQSFYTDGFPSTKGLGRFHIKLSSSSTRKSTGGLSQRKEYQWDSMPAGCLLPAHLPVVKLGDNVL